MKRSFDLNRLSIFKEVVLAGSFTKAAELLRQPKSRVSRNIASLEKELGVPLIYRTTRQFQLTAAGHDLFQSVAPLLNTLSSSVDRVSSNSNEISGTIKVTVSEDVGVELMGTFCHEFMTLFPRVKVLLHASNELVDVVKESFDVALRMGAHRENATNYKCIGQTHLYFVASPQLLARVSHPLRLEDLQNLPFLAFESVNQNRQSMKITNGREVRSVQLKPVFQSNNFFVLREMAKLGSGFTILPPFVARECLSSGTLMHALKGWTTEPSSVSIVTQRIAEQPLRVKKFVEFLTRKLEKVL